MIRTYKKLSLFKHTLLVIIIIIMSQCIIQYKKLSPDALTPFLEGYTLYLYTSKEITIDRRDIRDQIIPTGIEVRVPVGYCGEIKGVRNISTCGPCNRIGYVYSSPASNNIILHGSHTGELVMKVDIQTDEFEYQLQKIPAGSEIATVTTRKVPVLQEVSEFTI